MDVGAHVVDSLSPSGGQGRAGCHTRRAPWGPPFMVGDVGEQHG